MPTTAVTHEDHRPRILRAGSEADSIEIARLRSSPCVEVLDTLLGQLQGLLRARHPGRRMAPAELDALVRQHLAGVPLQDHGAWVHYPWSRRLVHLLDEPEFVELRTNRNRCKITGDEQQELARWRVGVAGLSAGQAVALTLALERGCGELRLADFDPIALSDLNRMRTGVHNLGLSKALVTAREIAEIDPYLRVVCFPDGVARQNIQSFLLDGGPLELLIDACDSLDAKLLLRLEARAWRIPVLMHTCDRGMLDVERFDLYPARPIFHGLLDDIQPERLRGRPPEEQAPHLLRVLGHESLSPRLRASLLEIDNSIEAWPQLASAAALGGAVAADVSRRLALHQVVPSGRYFVDLEQLIGEPPVPAASSPGQSSRRSESIEAAGRRLAIRQFLLRAGRTPEALLLGEAQIKELVGAGVLAPSEGNSQPWRWVYSAPVLFLFLDPARCSSRLAGTHHPDGVLALGAAAENVVLRAHHLGLEVRLRALPVPEEPDLLAAFEFMRSPGPATEGHPCDALHRFVARRCTNRRIGPRLPLQPGQADALAIAVRTVPGADLHVLETDDALREIAQLAGAADRIRILDPELHAEHLGEIRWTRAETERRRDGIDIEALELSAADREALEACRSRDALELLRCWGRGEGLEKLAHKAIEGASAVALISMRKGRRIDHFEGGRAVQRTWLAATRQGLAVQPMNALPWLLARLGEPGFTPDPELRDALLDLQDRFRKLFPAKDCTADVLLMRLSLAGEPTHRSLRRPVDEVLSIAGFSRTEEEP